MAHVVAVLPAGWPLERVSVAVLIRGGKYGHEDPRRVLLASEKALSTLLWVLRPSFLTRNVSWLARSAPSVFLGVCGEQQVFPMLMNVYITF